MYHRSRQQQKTFDFECIHTVCEYERTGAYAYGKIQDNATPYKDNKNNSIYKKSLIRLLFRSSCKNFNKFIDVDVERL